MWATQFVQPSIWGWFTTTLQRSSKLQRLVFCFQRIPQKKAPNIKHPKALWCRSTTDMTKTKGAQTKLLKTCIYICIITIMINNNYRFKKIKHEYTQLQFLPSKIKQGSPALSRSRHWSGSHVAWWPGSGSFFCTSEGKLKNRGSTRNSIDIYIMYIIYIYIYCLFLNNI